jgi:protein-tyrosine phosphatase
VACAFPDVFSYMHLDLLDTATQDLSSSMPPALEFISSGLKTGAVLVHCRYGVSRSASIVIAFLMQHDAMSFETALEHCVARRPCVEPNQNFTAQLRQLDIVKSTGTTAKT